MPGLAGWGESQTDLLYVTDYCAVYPLYNSGMEELVFSHRKITSLQSKSLK